MPLSGLDLDIPFVGDEDPVSEAESLNANPTVGDPLAAEEAAPPLATATERPKFAMRAGGDTVELPYAWLEVEQSAPAAPANVMPVAATTSEPSSSEPVASEPPADEPASSPERFSWLRRLADRSGSR